METPVPATRAHRPWPPPSQRETIAAVLVLALAAIAILRWTRGHETTTFVGNRLTVAGPAPEAVAVHTRKERPVYRYSVIPGGAESSAELEAAITHDPVVAEHYATFDLSNTRIVPLDAPRTAFVSYRIGDHVYWTKRRVQIPKGELVLTDGLRVARARCGNQVADAAGEVSPLEPSEVAFDEQVADPSTTPGGLAADSSGRPDPRGPLSARAIVDPSANQGAGADGGTGTDSSGNPAAQLLAELGTPGGPARFGLFFDPISNSAPLYFWSPTITSPPGAGLVAASLPPSNPPTGGASALLDSSSPTVIGQDPLPSTPTGSPSSPGNPSGPGNPSTPPIDLQNPPIDPQQPVNNPKEQPGGPVNTTDDPDGPNNPEQQLPVPEPASVLLLLTGVALAARNLRTRTRRSAAQPVARSGENDAAAPERQDRF
jgi:hypothetical protein